MGKREKREGDFRSGEVQGTQGSRVDTDEHHGAPQGHGLRAQPKIDMSRQSSSISGPRRRSLLCVMTVRFSFVLASPRVLRLFRSFFDSNVSFAHVPRISGPIVCIVNLYSVHEPFSSRSFVRNSP